MFSGTNTAWGEGVLPKGRGTGCMDRKYSHATVGLFAGALIGYRPGLPNRDGFGFSWQDSSGYRRAKFNDWVSDAPISTTVNLLAGHRGATHTVWSRTVAGVFSLYFQPLEAHLRAFIPARRTTWLLNHALSRLSFPPGADGCTISGQSALSLSCFHRRAGMAEHPKCSVVTDGVGGDSR